MADTIVEKPNLNMTDVLSSLNDDKAENEEKTPDIDLLADPVDEDENEEETALEESEEESEKVKDEKKSDKEEKESEDEPDIELTEKDPDEYSDVPARKAILTKYPKLFKEFPGLERAMYREQKYTEVFPSIKEAESAKATIQNYGAVEQDLNQGNIAPLLSAIKNGNDKSFKKLTATFLTQLQTVDKDSYFGVVNTVLKQALTGIVKAAKEMDDSEEAQQYQLAAALVHKAIYGNSKVTPYQMEVPDDKEDPKAEELKQREQAYHSERLTTAVQDVDERLDRTVKGAIEKNIDPRGVMPEYLKSKAVEDTWNKLNKIISSDKRFVTYRDELWKQLIKENYSATAKAKVVREVLKKAQSILPDVIKQVRADAMKGLSRIPVRKLKREEAEADEEQQPEDRRQAAPRSNQTQKSNRPSKVGNVSDVLKFLET
jgi:hypothetical protein